MSVIDEFLQQYVKEVDFYEKAAKICAEICESELEREGIRAIVTHRAKRIDRLKDKLIKRNERKNYSSIDDIYKDIVDLAGVRIAIYFPDDKIKIDKFIKAKFKIKQIKEFPQSKNCEEKVSNDGKYKKVFSGYHATHYRINLKPQTGSIEDAKYGQANIEIQVASVLMHAYAEVEHDLVYKPLSGELSYDEYEILDEINGLVLSGELALKRLQKAVKERIRKNGTAFTNHYELAAFIYDRISATTNTQFEDINMGRADVLFKFLKTLNFNRPECVEKYIEKVDPECKNASVVEQIVDMITEEDSSTSKVYLSIKTQMESKNPYSNSYENNDVEQSKKAAFYFLDKWSDFQYIMRKYVKKFYPDVDSSIPLRIESIMKILNDKELDEKLKGIKIMNTQLIHGDSVPSDEKLIAEGKVIEQIIGKIISNFSDEEKEDIEKKINEINIEIN
ncbi:MAG TPA: hypothetical protein DEF85_04670 [Clostridiaceae bacterium]|jgi:ppGpp synthetase/RelA/SpoT-type nucleotidyltranferase|nr:hypothetical protein [Clostridiaceae bacterium]HBG38126.1 hypothetical protein [Clostridiaceae bacterium]HBN28299.1 hypothetical protein [Clostridiaceae bacterium]HBX48167.1 hypothetical protein [Clostridiaceae bacterium]HCL49717.1 hypothetical protein [Clostridiaceae bacterium]